MRLGDALRSKGSFCFSFFVVQEVMHAPRVGCFSSVLQLFCWLIVKFSVAI